MPKPFSLLARLDTWARHHLTCRPSPLSALPYDILSQVFLLCLPEQIIYFGDGDGGVPSPQTMSTPLDLARVCSAWREVALSVPELWSRIHFQFTAKHSAAQRARVTLFLKRSSSYPLHIRLMLSYDSDHISSYARQSVALIIDALVAQSFRWKKVWFWLQYDEFVMFVNRIRPLPLLQSFNLYAQSYNRPFPNDALANMLAIAPKLHTLTLNIPKPASSSFSLPESCAHLKRCSIAWIPLSPCLDILRVASGLQEYDLRHCTFPFLSDQSMSQTTSHIHSLTLAYIQNVHGFLNHIALPSLASLVIRSTPKLSPYAPFLARSGSMLRELTLDIISFTDDELIDVLQLVPELHTLTIRGPYSTRPICTPAMFQCLTLPTWVRSELPQAIPVPRLHTILLDTAYDSLSLPAALAAMIESRSTSSPLVGPLLHVHLTLRGSQDVALKSMFDRLRRDKLELEYRFDYP
jgi:hypothetical protein